MWTNGEEDDRRRGTDDRRGGRWRGRTTGEMGTAPAGGKPGPSVFEIRGG